MLLNCSRTKYNLKSDGGVTPLMSAVKMVNGFMVKQLLKKDSEIISSTDDEGRTAVHWAAMVDNIEALRMLVKCGSETIKDAQDNKVCLFRRLHEKWLVSILFPLLRVRLPCS